MKKAIAPRTVSEVMSRDVVTVGPLADLKTINKILEERDGNGAPVVDGEVRLLGMVTRRDVLKSFVFSE